ncbi:hypothetical protein [Undibacterium sp.]|uniref:hypothetical protein n=1 Tax=Undibacterium sp. TaxID=1914977 RepID=UPI00374DF6E0
MRVANTSNTQQPISLAPAKTRTTAQTATDPANGTAASSAASATGAAAAQDTVTLSGGAASNAASATYANPSLNKTTQAPDLASMLEESNRKAQQIIDLIRPLVEQQGLKLADVASGSQQLSADPATIAKAKDDISEDGDFGVKKTAERILSFAKASIGDDPAKLDAVRAAVEKGFAEAQTALGGKLPDISNDTLKAIEDTFDSWKANGIPSGNAVIVTPAASDSSSGTAATGSTTKTSATTA